MTEAQASVISKFVPNFIRFRFIKIIYFDTMIEYFILESRFRFVMKTKRIFLSLITTILLFQIHVSAQESNNLADYIKENYTKREVMIPMRDGVKLFTAIYEPRAKTEKYPILLSRTPYTVSPYGADKYRNTLGPSDLYAREGYIFVYQDVRGKWKSEGEYVDVRPDIENRTKTQIDESTDTFDTVDYLIKNVADNNGRVGIYGISYPGFYTSAGIIDSHPAIKAASPQAPVSDWFMGDDFHHNGAFFLPHGFNFYSRFGQPRPKPVMPEEANLKRFNHGTTDGYKYFLELGAVGNTDDRYREQLGFDIPFWNEMMKHPNYDQFWKDKNILPKLNNIKCAVMTVGGLFDAEDLYGAWKTYEHIEKQNPGIYNVVVMGPWFHGGWARSNGDKLGNVAFGANTSEFYRTQFELPFFNHFLKDKGDISQIKEVNVFETGDNEWTFYDSWKPENAVEKTLYLGENGNLSFNKPSDKNADSADSYISNPAKPVPFTEAVNVGMTREYMTDDQRFAGRRPDVLVYQTEVLTENLTVAGEISPEIYVSVTNANQKMLDADFIVKVIDVFPDNTSTTDPLYKDKPQMNAYQMLVRGEPMRARFRNSFEKPEPLESGKVHKVPFTMPAVNHTFKKGHRLMVQIQSTWFPLVDRNPQKFVANIFDAKDADYITTTNAVYHSNMYPSGVKIQVLDGKKGLMARLYSDFCGSIGSGFCN